MKRTSLLMAAVLALVLAACGGTQSSPSAEASQAAPSIAASQTPEPTPEASEAAPSVGEPGGSAGAAPSLDIGSFTCEGSEVADRLPQSIGGEALQTFCMDGEAFAASPGTDPTFDEFLNKIDAEASDISVAAGGTTDGSLGVFAIRVAGVAEDRLEQEFLSASQDQGDLANIEPGSIGGKDVWIATDESAGSGETGYLYVKDDTLYFITAPDEDAAAEILGALP